MCCALCIVPHIIVYRRSVGSPVLLYRTGGTGTMVGTDLSSLIRASPDSRISPSLVSAICVARDTTGRRVDLLAHCWRCHIDDYECGREAGAPKAMAVTMYCFARQVGGPRKPVRRSRLNHQNSVSTLFKQATRMSQLTSARAFRTKDSLCSSDLQRN
jgi:hypothetical protein